MTLLLTDAGVAKARLKRVESRPVVSVGLPVFDGENYLAEAVESVLAQRLADLELTICDENGGEKVGHWSGGVIRLRSA